MPQTMEVALARVYNWEVVQKRKEKGDDTKDTSRGDSQDDGKTDS